MSASYDAAIVGLGAMGSSIACQLSGRGKRVIGFDMYDPPHQFGSTHGESRIIREAYFEHPLYEPLVQRSYEIWNDLEKRSGRTLLRGTGGLLIGPRDGVLIGGTRLSADRFGIDYDLLSAAEIRKRYGVFAPSQDLMGVLEPRAGILFPEKCVEVNLSLAAGQGADLHVEEPVTEWKPKGDGVRIRTERGSYDAGRMILAPGPWMGFFVPDLRLPLSIERQVLHWFQPDEDAAAFELGRLPVYAWEYEEGSLFYGFPNLGSGVKVALHHQGLVTDVDSLDRTVGEDEKDMMRGIVGVCMPKLAGPLLRSETCMYTNTPDEHFLIDAHPELPQVLIVSPCSGHGFKFAAVIGEIVADLVTKGATRWDISHFRLDRFREEKRS